MPGRPSPAAQKPRFILRRRAEADLEEIGDYTLEHWGEAKLVEYVTMLNHAFRALAADPNLGRAADDVRKGYFRHHVGSHIVYFRRKKARVEIVRTAKIERDRLLGHNGSGSSRSARDPEALLQKSELGSTTSAQREV